MPRHISADRGPLLCHSLETEEPCSVQWTRYGAITIHNNRIIKEIRTEESRMAIATAPPLMLAVGSNTNIDWEHRRRRASPIHLAHNSILPAICAVALLRCQFSAKQNTAWQSSALERSHSQRRAPVSEALTRTYQANHRSGICVWKHELPPVKAWLDHRMAFFASRHRLDVTRFQQSCSGN